MTAFMSRRRFNDQTSPFLPQPMRPTPYRTRGAVIGQPGWGRYLAVTLAGAGGFVALLMASRELPEWATALRILALIWFACFGVLRLTLYWRR
jgi:hypothetical protein